MKVFATLTALTLAASVAFAADSTKTETKDTSAAPAKVDTNKVESAKAETPEGAAKVDTITTESGLKYIDRVVGTGAEAVKGKQVQVHYTGWLLENGKRSARPFDSSVDRGEKFAFALGAGQVIRGWDEGVAGMKVGGKRELIIPADLGYGSRGAGGVIPPNATLLFEVELFDVTAR